MTTLEQFLLDASLRAAIVLAVAACLSLGLMLCRASAAVRHRVWCLGLAGSLAVPVLMALVPALAVPAPWLVAEIEPVPSETNGRTVLVAWASPEEVGPANPTSLAGAAPATTPQRTFPPATAANAMPQFSWLLLAWSIGAVLAMTPTFLGILSLWNLRRHSAVISGGPLLIALRRTSSQLGLERPVRLLVSAERSMPMTWGVFRPTILLPAAAASWPQEQLQMVLLHELAHVARRDCLAQLIGQLARAVYWFNPLAWIAERCLRGEQERACDDFVISRGTNPPDYAEQLLSVAASCLPARGAAVALAMAGPSRLETRLNAILNPRQNRQPLAKRPARIIGASAMALTALVSALQLEPTTAQAQVPAQKQPQQPGGAVAATDRAKSLADLRSKIVEQYAKPVNENEILQGAIKGMVQSLGDPHSDYLTPESLAQMEKQIAGNLTGIGAQLEMHEQQIRVVTPLPGSPALRAGVQPGDVLLEIDGQPTKGIELAEAVKKIVGPTGTSVKLAMGRGDQKVDVTVTRGAIALPTIRAFRSAAAGEPDFMLDATQKIGYIQVDQFGSQAPQEMQAAIDSLKRAGLKGLILDLRNCPGGMLDSAVGVAKQLLSGGTIVTIHRRGGETTPIKADGGQAGNDFPVVVLVNGQTASAAEVLVGALQDNRRALVLGTRTFGKGSIQALIKLDDGSGAIRITTSEYRLPSGRSIDKRSGDKTWGIDPDDGYFVSVDLLQAKALQERRQQRHIVGKKSDGENAKPAAVTPATLEDQERDPQFAAALKTLTARLQTGNYSKVSTLSAAQIEQFLKHDEIEQRRSTALQNLQKIDQELAALGAAPPAKN